MGGTPLFPDLGKHCSQESCNQLDFLPFRCDGCDKLFCVEHRSYRDHECPNANMRDRVVHICPACSSSVFQVFNEDPSLTLRKHAESGDCNPGNKIKKPPSCPVKRCKETLTFANSNVCKSCGVKTCLKHRFPSDHTCSGGGNTNGNHTTTKFLAAFAKRQGRQCESSASATKLGKPSGVRVIKDLPLTCGLRNGDHPGIAPTQQHTPSPIHLCVHGSRYVRPLPQGAPMAPGKALTRIEPCPTVKNSSLSTIGSNPFGRFG